MSTDARNGTEEAQWYFVHTYSGQEERVRRNLEQRAETLDVKHLVQDIVVPTEEVEEFKGGKRVSADDEREQKARPVPLEEHEVLNIMDRIKETSPKKKMGLERGQPVRITDGPFADFLGTVDEVDQDKGRLRVLVSFFGRETPVELDFLQVEKQ